jgi:sugar phosphate isomerase/epimerase
MPWTLSAFADEAGQSTDEQIAVLKQTGIDHIDPRNVDGFTITELPVDRAREVRARYDEAGIKVNMFGSPIGKIDIADDFEADVKRLEHLAPLAEVFDCRAVRIFSYFNAHGAAEHEWRAAALERLNKLVDLAEKLDLVLYHENEKHIFGEPVRRVTVLRDEINARRGDRFKMIFDFDNFNQAGEDVWEAWRELGPTAEAIHLKESKRQPDGSYQHVPSGTGDGHVPEVLADLAERGWEGPLTLEPHLAHSAAVLATGPSGAANQAMSDLTPVECFELAADAAKKLLADVGKR